MKTTNNTVLITGGSAGIGLEIAKLFDEQGNHVIITGRNEERLQKAAAQLKKVTTIVSDVSREEELNALAERLKKDFPRLNIVINNAGNAYVYKLNDAGADAAQKAAAEMQTNFFAILSLNEKLMPLLAAQEEAAIVTVSSIVALVPGINLPTYAASKAALHAYTRALRLTLKNSNTKVFELMPPLVNTEFSKEIGGETHGMPAKDVALALLEGIATDTYELQVGGTADLFKFYHADQEGALEALNAGR